MTGFVFWAYHALTSLGVFYTPSGRDGAICLKIRAPVASYFGVFRRFPSNSPYSIRLRSEERRNPSKIRAPVGFIWRFPPFSLKLAVFYTASERRTTKSIQNTCARGLHLAHSTVFPQTRRILYGFGVKNDEIHPKYVRCVR